MNPLQEISSVLNTEVAPPDLNHLIEASPVRVARTFFDCLIGDTLVGSRTLPGMGVLPVFEGRSRPVIMVMSFRCFFKGRIVEVNSKG